MSQDSIILTKSLHFAARIVNSNEEGNSMLSDCLEIKRILIATLKTARENSK